MNIKKRLPLVLLFTLCVLLYSLDAWPDPKEEMIFDKRVSYDVYVGNHSFDSHTIIRDIEILEMKEIYGKSFLVIRPHEFKLKDAKGYLLLDSVLAILPKSEFRITHKR